MLRAATSAGRDGESRDRRVVQERQGLAHGPPRRVQLVHRDVVPRAGEHQAPVWRHREGAHRGAVHLRAAHSPPQPPPHFDGALNASETTSKFRRSDCLLQYEFREEKGVSVRTEGRQRRRV